MAEPPSSQPRAPLQALRDALHNAHVAAESIAADPAAPAHLRRFIAHLQAALERASHLVEDHESGAGGSDTPPPD